MSLSLKCLQSIYRPDLEGPFAITVITLLQLFIISLIELLEDRHFG